MLTPQMKCSAGLLWKQLRGLLMLLFKSFEKQSLFLLTLARLTIMIIP